MLKTLFSYINRHKKLFLADMFCAVLISAIDLVYPYISRIAMNRWLPESMFKTFFAVMAIVLVSYLLRTALYYIVTYYGHLFGLAVEADMRRDLFEHLQDLSFSFFDNNRTGALMSRVTHDLFEIVELSHHGPENVVISVLTIGGALVVLFTVSRRLALVLTVMVPLLVFFVYRIGKIEMEKSVEAKKAVSDVNVSIESALSGMRTGKAFANEEIEKDKFREATKGYVGAKTGQYKYMAIFNSGTEFCYALMPLVVLCSGGYFILQGKLDYVDLVTFMLYVNTFVAPLRRISTLAETFANGMAGLERFTELMAAGADICDPENPKEFRLSGGEIEFDNVSFSYKENEEILHGLNLTVKAGETVAVVGSSGGGKTTLCQLVPRFYDVDEGAIRIDGIDIRELRQHELRKQIGIVQQDVFLFADSIKENIRYGRPDATDEEVYQAAKKAELYDDVMAMPDGFDTYVGERGTMLSGGQKQRVAIARIFLKNPPILILDEATSALDSVTEAGIQNAFDQLSVGRTTMIIAHRLSTIKKASRIIVIDEGRIKEEGSQEELLARGGIYAKLYRTQMAE